MSALSTRLGREVGIFRWDHLSNIELQDQHISGHSTSSPRKDHLSGCWLELLFSCRFELQIFILFTSKVIYTPCNVNLLLTFCSFLSYFLVEKKMVICILKETMDEAAEYLNILYSIILIFNVIIIDFFL